MKNFVLDLFFPKACLECRTEGTWVCDECLRKIKFLEKQKCPKCKKENTNGFFCNDQCSSGLYFDRLIVCTDYMKGSLVQKLIVRLKYKFSEEIACVLGEILRTQFVYWNNFNDALIVPVPIHKKRLKMRGFNQTLLLAKYLESSIGVEVCDCLERKTYENAQAKLDREHRLKNLNGCISLRSYNENLYRASLHDRYIVLIDDVATTGATLNECSKVLKDAGVRHICGFVLARG